MSSPFHRRLAPLALAALGLATPCVALDPAKAISQYNRDVWTTVQGLPQGSVLAIAQTADGYLWLGTRAGLVRFNGVTFAGVEPASLPGLSGGPVQALHAARDGSLWIGTDGKGLLRYRDGEFDRQAQSPELLGESGNSFYLDTSGVLWAATWMGVLRIEAGKATRVDAQAGLPHNSVFDVAGDGKGTVWAATSLGLAAFRHGRLAREHRELDQLVPRRVLFDSRGALWVGTAAGLFRFDGPRATRLTTGDGLLADFITALAEDRDGNVWIGTEGGLNRWSAGRLASYSEADGLPGGSVASLLEDREGSLWIGLRGSGLVRLREGPLVTWSRPEGLAGDNVTCALQSKDGSLWLGTTHGLTRLRDGHLTSFTRRDGLLNDSITGLGEDPRFGVVIATYDKRLNTFRDGRIGVLPGLRVSSTVPSAIYSDRHGVLWIGTLGEGLYRLAGGRITHFPFAGSAGRYVIHSAHEDAQGTLWFATPNGLLKHEAGTFTPVEVYAQPPNLGVAYGLHGDADGVLWVATRDRGLCRLQQGVPNRCYGRAQGLFDDTVYRVLEDDQGRLVFSTPRGIGVVAREAFDRFDRGSERPLAVVKLGIEDGMKTAECQGNRWPSGWKASDGRLWFPTTKGAVVLDPRRLEVERTPPPVVIESVVANGSALPAQGSVAPGRGDLEVTYAGLGYRSPEILRFRYRLEGFDRGWVDAGSRRVALYTNLPPGSYRFVVTAALEGGTWNPAPATVSLTLEPRYWQTRVWRAGLLVAALCLVWAFYRWRLRRLSAHAAELSRKVNEALANAKVLSGLLPICASCKRIRSDKGYWEQIEGYIRDHSEADFTHGLCPACVRTLYPDLADQVLSGARGGRDSSRSS